MVGGERLLGPLGEGANGSGGGGGVATRSSSKKKKKGKRLTGEVGALAPRARPRRQDLHSGVPDGERRRGIGGPGRVWLSAWPSEGGGGGGRCGVLTSGGHGRQRRRRDGGGWQSGGALVQEQGRGRHQQVGQCRGWGPAAEREKKGERGACGPGFQI
jgi:hypothetical protein